MASQHHPRIEKRRWFFSYTLIASLLAVCALTLGNLYSSSLHLRGRAALRNAHAFGGQNAHFHGRLLVGRDPPTWESRVAKGQLLVCLFEALDETEARRINGDQPVASTKLDFALFQRWGYTEMEWTKAPSYDPSLDMAFTELGINKLDNKEFGYLHLCQDEKGDQVEILNDNGEIVEPTIAHFSNVVNPTAGAIVADDNVSPRQIGGAVDAYPALEQWSDVVFLQWQKYAGANIRNLGWCFRANIRNDDTRSWVIEAFSKSQRTSIPDFSKKVVFPMTTEYGLAILGTLNGAGCGYLVAQHKDQLGVKRIVEVTVWANSEWQLNGKLADLYLNMYFTIMNV